MKKANPDDLRPEYRREDLGPGVRGKYLESYRSGQIWLYSIQTLRNHFPQTRPLQA